MKPSTHNEALAAGRLFNVAVLALEGPHGKREAFGAYPAAESVDEALLFFARWHPRLAGRTAEVCRETGAYTSEKVGDFKVPFADLDYSAGTVIALRCHSTGEESRVLVGVSQ